MHSRRGLPPPHLSSNNTHTNHVEQRALAAHAVTAALNNPYAQYHNMQYTHSSHYAQAYMQTASTSYGPATTSQGYTLSQTYLPGTSQPASQTSSRSAPFNRQPSAGSWYQPGDRRCTHSTCAFIGSHKSVELHMMDRHLIYPPGWEKRKSRDDWDADPSLKGKPVPIQGTTLVLDNPEVLEAWIAERKKRWPSTSRVKEKERKLQEAIARGQLSLDDSNLFGRNKRRRIDEDDRGSERARGRGRGRGRGRERGRGVDGGWRGRGRGRGGISMPPRGDEEGSHLRSTRDAAVNQHQESDWESSSEDDNAPPEIVSSKAPPGIVDRGYSSTSEEEPQPTPQPLKPAKKPTPQQPKQLPRNPFALRPTLLRNLLLPEIRITVSNLSQAIRFLVDNHFLEGVELRAGEASEKMIEVIGEQNTTVDAPADTASDVQGL